MGLLVSSSHLSLATTLWPCEMLSQNDNDDDDDDPISTYGARPPLFGPAVGNVQAQNESDTRPSAPLQCRSMTINTLLFSKRFHIQPARENKHQAYSNVPKQAWRLSDKQREGKGQDRKAMPSKAKSHKPTKEAFALHPRWDLTVMESCFGI